MTSFLSNEERDRRLAECEKELASLKTALGVGALDEAQARKQERELRRRMLQICGLRLPSSAS